MKKVLLSIVLILLLSMNMMATAEAASVQAEFSIEKITLDKNNKEFKADINITSDFSFSGAEFTLKPENGVTIKSVSYNADSAVETKPLEKNGYYYFGFTNGVNKFDEGTLNIGTITFEYSENKAASMTMEQVDIIYIDETDSVKKNTIQPGKTINVTRDTDSDSGSDTDSGGGGNKKPKDSNNNTGKTDETPVISFSDVPEGFWAKKEIEFLASKGIIVGKGAGIFDPQGIVTRAEFSKMLAMVFDVVDENAVNNFSDVYDTDWYGIYVSSAVKTGIVKGYPDGTFKPNNSISRLEMAVMAGRALKLKGYGAPKDIEQYLAFNDRNLINFGETEVSMAVQNEIIKGKPGNRLDPFGISTRAEAAAVVYRLYNMIYPQ